MVVDLGSRIAFNVRAERVRQRLSQEELAGRLGWSRVTLSEVESGKRKILAADLPGLCTALGVSLARLLLDAAPDQVAALRLNEGP
jgi:transcriptional regulator with XRE-family HTH domain